MTGKMRSGATLGENAIGTPVPSPVDRRLRREEKQIVTENVIDGAYDFTHFVQGYQHGMLPKVSLQIKTSAVKLRHNPLKMLLDASIALKIFAVHQAVGVEL